MPRPGPAGLPQGMRQQANVISMEEERDEKVPRGWGRQDCSRGHSTGKVIQVVVEEDRATRVP